MIAFGCEVTRLPSLVLLNGLYHSMVWMSHCKHVFSLGCGFITDACEHEISISSLLSHGEPTASEVNHCMQECSPKALLSTACTLWFKLLFGWSHCGSSSSLMCIAEFELSADLFFFTSCSHVQSCRSRPGIAANSWGLIKTMIRDDYAYSQHEGSASCGASLFLNTF